MPLILPSRHRMAECLVMQPGGQAALVNVHIKVYPPLVSNFLMTLLSHS